MIKLVKTFYDLNSGVTMKFVCQIFQGKSNNNSNYLESLNITSKKVKTI